MTPLRFHMASDSGPLVNFQVDGLDRPESPFLTITETCAACGVLIASTQYDVRDQDVSMATLGERNAERFNEHWKRKHE